MTALAIEWIWWIFATFGIVGIICLWIFAPTVASIALKAVVAFFQFVFGYRLGCAIIAGALAFWAADYHRARLDEADWAARTAAFNKAMDARDEQIETDTRDQVWIDIANQTAVNNTTDTEVKEFHDALPPIATDCHDIVRVGAAADKLRAISGQNVRQPRGNKRVSKARPASPGT